MAKDPLDTQTIDALEQPRRRGRPRKPDAMTPAERMRKYRARIKAGLIQPQTKDSKRIAELEARIHELEIRNAKLEAENARLRENQIVTSYVKPIWECSGHQCQSAKKDGTRCGVKKGLRILEVDYKGMRYEMSVCPRHYDSPKLRPASEYR